MKKILTSFVLVICFIFVSVFTACGGPAAATVQSISITTMPQTQYVVGDSLNLEGGELTATYSDSTTKVVALTDPAVTVQRPNMNTVGEKTVSVTYQSKSATFKITVSEPQIDVTFDLNYDGGQDEVVSVDPNTTVTPPTDPTRAGYAFLGWYVEEGASSKFNFETPITAATTVYAHWGYSVEFDLNYENSQNTVQKVEVGAKVSQPANPQYTDHIFTGWYTESKCETPFNFDTPINANTVIYAGWREVGSATVYTVTFWLDDGANGTIVRQVVSGESVTKPEDPTLSGATFAGWYADEELTQEYDFDTPITENTTIYAAWDVENYTVTFHYNHENNDGIYSTTLIPNDEMWEQIGYTVSAPTDPVMAGYYFAGWYSEPECTNKVNFPQYLFGNYHYYAKWLKEWEFQAEYTDFGNREAFGYSANGTGASAFIMHNNAEAVGAHDGYWVANLHNKGLYVEFCITSSEEVFDAALVLRISADFYDITLDKTNFGIDVNGKSIDYDTSVVLTGAVSPEDGGIQNKRPFTNHVFLTDLHLKQGENVIRFTMLDEQRYGTVGTMYATAPMMDSIYIMTNATLSWTSPFPMTGNV